MERLFNAIFDWSLRLFGLGLILLVASVPFTAAGVPLGRALTLAGCSSIALGAALYALLVVAFMVGMVWALITE